MRPLLMHKEAALDCVLLPPSGMRRKTKLAALLPAENWPQRSTLIGSLSLALLPASIKLTVSLEGRVVVCSGTLLLSSKTLQPALQALGSPWQLLHDMVMPPPRLMASERAN